MFILSAFTFVIVMELRREHSWGKNQQGQPPRVPVFQARRVENGEGEYGGKEEEWAGRARTATKYNASMPFVEDSNLHHSVIEELQSLDHPPNNTEHFIRTGGTLDELRIRKSTSFDRDKIELSLSSEYIDLQSENQQLRRKVEEMDRQIRSYAELEQKVKLQLASQKREIEEYEQLLEQNENELSRVNRRLKEYENGYSSKDKELAELWEKLEEASLYITEVNNKLTKTQQTQQQQRNMLTRQKQSIINQYEHQISQLKESYSSQIHKLQAQFISAKQIGQSQISSLLSLLHKKQNQMLLLKNSTHMSSNLSRSKIDKPEGHFMNRYLNFARMIDRKLYFSQGKSSKQYEHSQATNSVIRDGNTKMMKFFNRFQEKRSQYLPQNQVHTIF